jgi:hypothetical protein
MSGHSQQPPPSQSSTQPQSGQFPIRRPSSSQSVDTTASNTGTMKIEEKIARAYHRDVSWRKVLVRLEPDAHNNMVVRRMFANAYGWPVVKHICDTHFAYTMAALTRDDEEAAGERAREWNSEAEIGEEVKGQTDPPSDNVVEKERREKLEVPKKEKSATLQVPNAGKRSESIGGSNMNKQPAIDKPENLKEDVSRLPIHDRTEILKQDAKANDIKNRDHRSPSEVRESTDTVPDMSFVSRVNATGTAIPSTPSRSGSAGIPASGSMSSTSTASDSYSSMGKSKRVLSNLSRRDSARWSDRYFEGSDEEEEEEELMGERQYVKEFEMAVERGGGDAKRSAETVTPGGAGRSAGSERDGKGKTRGKRSKSVLDGDVVEEPGEMGVDEEARLEKQVLSEGQEGSGGLDEQITNLTGIGLGKSVEEQTQHSPTVDGKERRRRASSGVAEQVAEGVAASVGKNTEVQS